MDNLLMETNGILQDSGSDELHGKYLTFWTDRQLFGIAISDVVQIIGMQPITPMPENLPYVKGVINLRGTIIPVIDMRLRLGREETEYNDRTCIIVTNIEDRYFGFIVDSVDEVSAIPSEDISPPPQMGGDPASRYLTGVAQAGSSLILIINTEKLLAEDDFINVSSSVG